MKERTTTELLELIQLDNIAPELETEDLQMIAEQVQKDFEAAEDSMQDWIRDFDQGEKINKPPSDGLSEPFEGAADSKNPSMKSSSNRFSQRATKELLKPKDLVKAARVGPSNPEDALVVNRTIKYMNFQVNWEIPDWRDNHYSLLHRLPTMGTVFKKTAYDPLQGTLVSDLIQYPDFRVMQHTDGINEIRNFTHLIYRSENEATSYERAGIWSDVDKLEFTSSDADIEDDSHDPMNLFYEMQCRLDLDDDGYEEPYIVTMHASSGIIVRIVAQYNKDSIFISVDDEVVPLSSLGEVPVKDKFGDKGTNENPEMEVDPVMNKSVIVYILSINNVTIYRFLYSMDGTFLGVGYCHLMAATIALINQANNSLINAGYLANMQGGFLARGAEFVRGEIEFRPGEYIQTDIAPIDMPNAIREHQFREPSQVLFELVQYLEGGIKELSASIDVTEMVAANQAASTLLMILEETQSAQSAIMTAQQRSLSKELQIIFRLNRIYTDAKIYKEITGDKQADFESDFDDERIILIPTANPEMASQSQRIQQGQILVDQAEFLAQAGANMPEIARFYLDAIGIEEVDRILPQPNEDTQQMMQQAAQAEQAQAESLTKLQDAQTEALIGEAKRTTAQAQADIEKLPIEIDELRAKIFKLKEEAETESLKNNIDSLLGALEVKERRANPINPNRTTQ